MPDAEAPSGPPADLADPRPPNSVELLRDWCNGDESAARELHDRYAERLVRLVGSRLGPRFNARFDPEDVVQSVLRTVFLRVRDGRHPLEGEALWPLLVQFTLHKLHNRLKRDRAARRAVGRESCGQPANELAAASLEPGPDDAAELTDLIDDIRRGLSEEIHRRIFDLLLAGHTQKEAAEATGRTERTVYRKLQDIRATVRARLGEPD